MCPVRRWRSPRRAGGGVRAERGMSIYLATVACALLLGLIVAARLSRPGRHRRNPYADRHIAAAARLAGTLTIRQLTDAALAVSPQPPAQPDVTTPAELLREINSGSAA